MSHTATLIVAAKQPGFSLGTLGALKVYHEIKRIFGEEIDLKTIQRRTKWLVNCKSVREVKIWKKLKLFLGVEIEVSESQTKLKAGVISNESLIGDSDEGIMEDLKSQGVVKLKNFPGKDKKRGPTFLIFFDGDILPSHVKIGYTRFKVREYEEDPLRCYQCNFYGHSAKNCRQKAKSCINCAENHEIIPGVRCEKPSKCSNCGSRDHNALSRTCPVYIREKEILCFATKEKKSVGDVKKELKEGLIVQSSYAQVVVNSKKVAEVGQRMNVDAESQTEKFHGCSFPPLKLLPPGTKIYLPNKRTQVSTRSTSTSTETSDDEMEISDIEATKEEIFESTQSKLKCSPSNKKKPPDMPLRRSERIAAKKDRK